MARETKFVGIIPVRMASTRFPGKPLALVHGRPIIEHVYRRAAMSEFLGEIYLATCDREIFDAACKFNARTIMTASTHDRCTDRVAEAAVSLDADIVVNIQGDEPLLDPRALDELCSAMAKDSTITCCNLVNEIYSEADFRSPNQVKVVCNEAGYAMYMSRQPIPTLKSWNSKVKIFRQLGIVAFRKDYLERFSQLRPTPLEQSESIDMLRPLEHGHPVKVVEVKSEFFGVDTPEDLEVVARKMKSDQLMQYYISGPKE